MFSLSVRIVALRLGVDARDLATDLRGIGRYARAIVRALVARNDIEVTLLARGPFPQRFRREYREVLNGDRFSIASRAHQCDLVWHPANGTFFRSNAPNVVTIHDAIPFRYPDADAKRRERQQTPFLRSASTAAAVIAVSRYGASEIQRWLNVPRERIEVIYHGVGAEFSPNASKETSMAQPIHGPFLLFVGDPIGEPRKNFAVLLQAYRGAWPRHDGPALVVVGGRDPKEPDVQYAGATADDVRLTHGPTLPELYRSALATCVPSYHETFGMPLIESMACGTPVVASDASCLAEIGDDAALFVPPDDAHAWAKALLTIVRDGRLHQRLRERGLERAREYSWQRSAQEHARLFHRVAGT